jgi:hypothetical protein
MSSRLSMYKEYYFPSTIKLWNPLDLNLCQMPTFSSFKVNLRKLYFQLKNHLILFFYREWYFCVLHTRLRNKCSSLNGDLRGRRGHDRMIVGFASTYAISAHHN